MLVNIKIIVIMNKIMHTIKMYFLNYYYYYLCIHMCIISSRTRIKYLL